MRTRLLASTLACVALSLGLGASAAQAGVRIVAPANDAIKTKAKVRVALAVSGARSLRVSLDNSDITRRLVRRGRLREAVLRGRLVEPGAHWLVVRRRSAEGRAERTIERRFLVARRFRSLAGKLFPRRSVHSASGVLRLRVAVRRGVGLMRARVNGRRVRVPHIGRLWPTTTLRLGARHGLRFGRNRVSVLAHDFRKARYDRETWTVMMRRSRPLAAGIAKHRAEAGGRAVRLDGRGARPTRARRRLSWSWRIVRKPRGSRARLVGRHWPRPRLRPDVPGHYRLAVTVSEHSRKRRGARAAQTGPETVQPVTVVADANIMPTGASLKIDLTWSPESSGSITVDEAPAAGLPDSDNCVNSPPVWSGPRRCVYRLPAEGVPYLLVLDALTLAPKAPGIKRVGDNLCPDDDDFRQTIEPWAGQNVIAILAFGGGCDFGGTTLAQVGKPSAYVFTPTSKPDLGIRSGWYSEATDRVDAAPAELQGFFQKSWPVGWEKGTPSDQYRFVPGNYVSFDTSRGGDPAGQNTMVVAGKEYTSSLPGGAAHGFQVLVLDKALRPLFGTPTPFANGAAVGDMARLLGQARATRGVSTVFVQSIGTPTPPAGSEEAWNAAAVQLENLGGNTDVFLSLGDGGGARPERTTGWYSFVAAPDPTCPNTPPTTICGGVKVEASTPLTESSGDVSGVLGRNQTWQYVPVINDVGGDEHTGELLTLAYRSPTPWPFSDSAAATRVLHYLGTFGKQGARDLRPLADASCYDPGRIKDVRSSYCNENIVWSDLHSDLGDSSEGAGVCGHYPGQDVVGADPGTYAAVCDQISSETNMLDQVSNGGMEHLWNQIGSVSAINAYLAVKDMSDKVKGAVEQGGAKANRDVTAEGLEIAGELVELTSLVLPEPASVIGEIVGGTVSLAGEVTSLAEGDEQGESAVATPLTVSPTELGEEMQERLSAAGAAFGHAWDMLVSDPAKLQAAYENFVLDPSSAPEECSRPGATCGIWGSVHSDLGNKEPLMQNAVRHWAAGKFMPATYDVWMLGTNQASLFQPGCDYRYNLEGCRRDVTPTDVPGIKCLINPGLNTRDWYPFAGVSADAAYYLRDRLGYTLYNEGRLPRRGRAMWLLGQTPNGDILPEPTPFTWGLTTQYPPQSLLSDLYAPPSTNKVGGGYGWERPWLYSKGGGFRIRNTGNELPYSNSMQCEWHE